MYSQRNEVKTLIALLALAFFKTTFFSIAFPNNSQSADVLIGCLTKLSFSSAATYIPS